MFKRKIVLVDAENKIICADYKGSMPLATRNNIGYMAVVVAINEKKDLKVSNKVLIWKNCFKQTRALSTKHAWVKAIRYIYFYDAITLFKKHFFSASINGQILRYPANSKFLESENLRQGAKSLARYWRQLLNDNIKFRELESPISL